MEALAKSEWIRVLLRDYEGRLLRYVRRFVGTEVARELVQEGFSRLWQEKPERLHGREREWLFCVCRNLALDYLKKEKRTVIDDKEESVPPEAEETMEKRQEESRLNKQLAGLSQKHREVVRLKFQESMSYEQISQVTGHSSSYVGVLLHEAMLELRKRMLATQAGGGK